MSPSSIVIASPHSRHDRLVENLTAEGLRVTRITSPSQLDLASLSALDPRYVLFPHWSWKIPAEVFQGFECVIFHLTDLPYGRGGSPLQNLIVRGHKNTMLTALRCVADIDAGPIYMKRPLSLHGTAEEILRRAADLTESMILDIVQLNPVPMPQAGEVTLFQRRRPEDGDLASLTELGHVYDFIRMLDADGYPHAFLETAHFRFEFTQASLQSDTVLANVRIVRKTHE